MSNEEKPGAQPPGSEHAASPTPPTSEAGLPWADLVSGPSSATPGPPSAATPPSPRSPSAESAQNGPAQDVADDEPAAPVPSPAWTALVSGDAGSAPSEPSPSAPEPHSEPSAASAESTPTEVLDPVVLAAASGTLGADDPVPPTPQSPLEDEAPEADRDWMGVTSFITGVLLLSPFAIIFGHLGLSAAKKGRARHRSFAIAGLILGYIGLVVAAVGLWWLLTDRASPAEVDIQAQQDVSAVGAAAATDAVATGAVPEVAQTDSGYTVGGESIPAYLSTEHTLTFTGSTASDWCLDISYEGGEETAFSYTATGGMEPGACATG